MTSYTLTLDLPQDIYQRAARAARTTEQPMEQVIVDWIMPPPSSHDELGKEIAELESQSEEMLIQIARSVMPEDDVARLRELFAMQRARGLTEAEQREAAALVEKEDLYTLRRARALYLLKKRNALSDELTKLLDGTGHGIHPSTEGQGSGVGARDSMSVTSDLTPEAMAVYRATARRRWEADQRERARRHERAWETARQATALLKEQFGATQVMVFGSLVHDDWFSETSDVDLVAWGLKGDEYFIAVARLQDLSPEFKVDLVAVEHCKPELREVIMKEGELL